MTDDEPIRAAETYQSQAARHAGYTAWRNGLPREAPGHMNEAAQRDWLTGWNAADREMREAIL